MIKFLRDQLKKFNNGLEQCKEEINFWIKFKKEN
jgi:hypothetical protein